MSDEIKLRQVIVGLCQACIDGIGRECHTPGCILWLHKVDIPIGNELLVDAPLPLFWTQNKPMQPGVFWYRDKETFHQASVLVAAQVTRLAYGGVLIVRMTNGWHGSLIGFDGEWAGPVQEPEP